MTIKEIHDLFKLLGDQSQSGTFSHEEIDVFLDRASMWMVAEMRRVYGEGVDTHECMAPFVRRFDFALEEEDDGLLEIDKDLNFMRLSVINVVEIVDGGRTEKGIEIVNDTELSLRLRSQLYPVSQQPVATVEGIGRWQIYPKEAFAGYVKFLKRPAKPVYQYVLSGRDETHDPSGSTDLEWGEGYINQVVVKALTLAGFNLDNSWIVEAGLSLDKMKV